MALGGPMYKKRFKSPPKVGDLQPNKTAALDAQMTFIYFTPSLVCLVTHSTLVTSQKTPHLYGPICIQARLAMFQSDFEAPRGLDWSRSPCPSKTDFAACGWDCGDISTISPDQFNDWKRISPPHMASVSRQSPPNCSSRILKCNNYDTTPLVFGTYFQKHRMLLLLEDPTKRETTFNVLIHFIEGPQL